MRILFNERSNCFVLETIRTSYIVGLVDGKYLGHIYYGNKMDDVGLGCFDAAHMLKTNESPFSPITKPGEKVSFMDCFAMEYPGGGIGDYRESAIEIRDGKGFCGCEFVYEKHAIYNGKPKLSGLPATFGKDDECMTLEITLRDEILDLNLTLLYSVFDDSDSIIRSAKISNKGESPVWIEKMYSASVDMDNERYEMITLHGSWARERHIDRVSLRHGKQSVSSIRGISSHQANPFMALVGPHTTQNYGDVYAMNFVYSGNFIARTELSQFDSVRMSMGIAKDNFCWKLEPGEEFQTPEVILMYSNSGIGGMTRGFHDLYRNHLIRSPYVKKPRPVLINNWEATYFDFDEEKLLDIAKDAKECGIEMLVMDDGWFGHRDSDNSSLGDWKVYSKKLPNGLKALVDKVNDIGLKFGIWFEPEMISPDSDLYRKHPDYAIRLPGRTPSQARNQYVLDLSRKEVVDQVFEQICEVLESANIEYVKWDMNRPLCDLGSVALPSDRANELSHRYMLGVYELQERLITRFPKLLLENCSGGGARFDPGMLYYSPQIWCSDDTDAKERLKIQEGTALVYPLSSIGAHVSVCPNHTVGRNTPWAMRGNVALGGTFGYELDITKISSEEKNIITDQIDSYHKYSSLIMEGDYYRLASYSENNIYDCWQVVSKDKKESLVVYNQVAALPNAHSKWLKLSGLSENARYKVYIEKDTDISNSERSGEKPDENVRIYSGAQLMYMGILIESMFGDGRTVRFYLVKE